MSNAQFCPVCGEIISDGCAELDEDGEEVVNENGAIVINYSPCSCDHFIEVGDIGFTWKAPMKRIVGADPTGPVDTCGEWGWEDVPMDDAGIPIAMHPATFRINLEDYP